MKRQIVAVLGASVLLASGAMAGTAGAAKKQSAGMTTHTIQLKSIGGSGVTGTAVFTYDPKAKITTVKLTVKHLKAKSLHPAHIHLGRCGASGAAGNVIHAFPSILAGNNGIGVVTTSFSGTFTHKKWAVNVHTGPHLVPASQYKVLACGNVT